MSKPKRIKRKRRNNMEASRVTIKEETMLKNTLDPARKREMKFESVCAVIRSKPAGTKLRHSDLIPAAGYSSDVKNKSYRAGYAYIKNLVKTGKLIQEDFPHTTKKVWTIPDDAKIIVEPKTVENINDVEEPEPCFVNEVGLTTKDEYTLEEQAKQFAWSNNSDSLRDFIRYMNDSTRNRLW